MTNYEKEQIKALRGQGLGCSAIATALGLNRETVKTFLRRNPPAVCPTCGKNITMTPHKRKRRFCSDQCRMDWWKAHPEKMSCRKLYPHTCERCGTPFETPKASSHFCSRKCYAEARRMGVSG